MDKIEQIKLHRVAVFCGSSSGKDECYVQEARLLGSKLANKGIGVVYGGSNVGLMNAVADGALEEGGEVIGVIPGFLDKRELAHKDLSQLVLVDTMHERKYRMNQLADGVIALPGGYGTLEEYFEMLTWAQLGLHKKPVALFNINHFYDPLIELVQRMVDECFLKETNQKMLLVSDDIEDLLNQMYTYQPPVTGKWIRRGDNDSTHRKI